MRFFFRNVFSFLPFIAQCIPLLKMQLLKGNYRISIHNIMCRATNAVDVDAILAVNT